MAFRVEQGKCYSVVSISVMAIFIEVIKLETNIIMLKRTV